MRPTDESLTPMQCAQAAFGPEPASGLFVELVKLYGPLLAEFILRWLASRPFDTPERAQAALVSSETLWEWAKSLLRSYRGELIDLIRDRAEMLVDLLLAQLD